MYIFVAFFAFLVEMYIIRLLLYSQSSELFKLIFLLYPSTWNENENWLHFIWLWLRPSHLFLLFNNCKTCCYEGWFGYCVYCLDFNQVHFKFILITSQWPCTIVCEKKFMCKMWQHCLNKKGKPSPKLVRTQVTFETENINFHSARRWTSFISYLFYIYLKKFRAYTITFFYCRHKLFPKH